MNGCGAREEQAPLVQEILMKTLLVRNSEETQQL